MLDRVRPADLRLHASKTGAGSGEVRGFSRRTQILMFAERARPQPPTLRGHVLGGQGYMRMPAFLSELLRTHGPFVRFHNVVGNDIYFAAEPAAIEEVLVTKASSFSKARGTRRLRRLLGNGLLTAERPEHLPHRRLVQPAFHRKRLDDYARVMVEASLGRVASWQDGSIIDVDRETNRLALEIAAQALFGADLHDDMEAISRALSDALSTFPASMLPFSELFDNLPVPITLKFKRAKRTLDAVVLRMVREHRVDGRDRGDVLSVLLAARDEDAGGMDDEQIRDEAMTILLAGHETTANALAWTFYLLQRAPAVEAELHAHLAVVLAGRTPTFDDVARLTYVRALLSEAMRLYPPAWITARRATEPVTIGGYGVRARDIVIVSQWVTHRDPRFWSDPERFDPSRFLRPLPERFAYFPFGGGTRICIGEAFAWTEGILAIATIAQRVRLAAVGDDEVGTLPLVTLRPRSPIRARVSVRVPERLRSVPA